IFGSSSTMRMRSAMTGKLHLPGEAAQCACLGAHAAVMRIDDGLNDRQTQTRAAACATARTVDAVEAVGQTLQFIGRHTGRGILPAYDDAIRIRVHADGEPAARIGIAQ